MLKTVPVHCVKGVFIEHELQMVLEGSKDPGPAYFLERNLVLLMDELS